MPNCSKCNMPVPPDAKLCPDCGAEINRETVTEPSKSSDSSDGNIHNLLLKAHLYKIRGDSERAIQECIRALRINPDNIEAHCLLGDIYKSQGRIEEASHWYKLALDLSPNSRINRARLEELRFDKARLDSIIEEELSKPAANSWNPTLIVIAAAVLVLLGFFLMLAYFRSKPAEYGQRYIQEPDYQVTPPAVYSPTVPQQTNEPVIKERPPEIVATDAAITLMHSLNERPALADSGLKVTSVILDPRYNSAIITFISPSAEEGITGQNLTKNSIIVCREGFLTNDAVTYITIRVLARIQTEDGSHIELALVADTEREKVLQIEPNTSTYQEQLDALSNTWWHEDVR